MFQTKNMEKWLNYQFDPVECRTGRDFANFARNLKSELTAQLQGSGCQRGEQPVFSYSDSAGEEYKRLLRRTKPLHRYPELWGCSYAVFRCVR